MSKDFYTLDGYRLTDFSSLSGNNLDLLINAYCAISNEEQQKIRNFYHNLNVKINFSIVARAISSGVKRNPSIKNVIAIGAGKGGVGKTSIAVNLARAYNAIGVRTGLLDLDLNGPNIPRAFGNHSPNISKKQHNLVPAVYEGIQTISLAQVVADNDPILWRGPMAGKVAEQLFNGSEWQDLDYLIIDLPPGTGDIHMTVCQSLPITAAVVVTTPQSIACMDANKAISMFSKLGVPALGYINNMSFFDCENCKTRHNIFIGEEPDLEIACLMQMPLHKAIAEANENSRILPENLILEFDRLAFKIALALNSMQKDRSGLLPKLEIVTKGKK